MIIITDKGQRILIDDYPHRIEGNPYYFATGTRWIKSRGSWSTSRLIHSFRTFAVECGQEATRATA